MGRIILKGDIHGDALKLYNFDDEGFTKDDIIIVLGDFGVIWEDKKATERILEILGEKNFTIAFVDGNHENFNLIKEMEEVVEWNGGHAGLLPGGIIHLMRGEIYNINNKRIGVCGGANSVDLWHRTEGKSWWKEEEITEIDIANLLVKTSTNNHLDIMLSHDCPADLVPLVALYSKINGVKISNSQRMLQLIKDTIQIDKWYFGHWHLDLKFDDKFECLYNNFKEV